MQGDDAIDTPVSEAFIDLVIKHKVLIFGDFTLKSGRRSPYFFNLGHIDDGAGMVALGKAYADTLVQEGFEFDVLFGPAYKGIPIAVATAMALHAHHGQSVGVTFNRKEAKDHGEGGQFVGHPLEGRILIVDDVLTAGTAVLEAVGMIQKAPQAELCGVLLALDRQERLGDDTAGVQVTAVKKLSQDLAIPVKSIANLQHVIAYLEKSGQHADTLARIRDYQREYCAQS